MILHGCFFSVLVKMNLLRKQTASAHVQVLRDIDKLTFIEQIINTKSKSKVYLS